MDTKTIIILILVALIICYSLFMFLATKSKIDAGIDKIYEDERRRRREADKTQKNPEKPRKTEENPENPVGFEKTSTDNKIWTEKENMTRIFENMINHEGKSCGNCYWNMDISDTIIDDIYFITCNYHIENFKQNSLCSYWTNPRDSKVLEYQQRKRENCRAKIEELHKRIDARINARINVIVDQGPQINPYDVIIWKEKEYLTRAGEILRLIN